VSPRVSSDVCVVEAGGEGARGRVGGGGERRPGRVARPPDQERPGVDLRAGRCVGAERHAAAADPCLPELLLGLTATPDRADEADLLSHFDDHEAYRADRPRPGDRRGRPRPLRRPGLPDATDDAPIPWRNRRFDPAELARAVPTWTRARFTLSPDDQGTKPRARASERGAVTRNDLGVASGGAGAVHGRRRGRARRRAGRGRRSRTGTCGPGPRGPVGAPGTCG